MGNEKASIAAPRLILLSASPARRKLLRVLGIPFRSRRTRVNEAWDRRETPGAYVRRLAVAKAHVARTADLPHLTADTAVEIDGAVLGKPTDLEDARRMLATLSGRWHRVHTAVALRLRDTLSVRLCTSKVGFRSLSPAELEGYCATGEPLGKAGAYAIQGLGALFVSRLEGSYSGVVGLPLYETAELLNGAGLDPLACVDPPAAPGGGTGPA